MGSIKPCPTRVTRITEKVRKRIRSRCGNVSPLSVVNGIPRAAASETTPRTPVKASAVGHCHGGGGSLRLIADEPARKIGRGIHPGEARDDHHGADDGGGDRQVEDRVASDAGNQRSSLQAGDKEHHAFDQVDQELPEEHALKARRGADQPKAIPANIEPDGYRGEHARPAQILGRPIGEEWCQDRERDLDARVADPAPQPQHHPTNADPPEKLAGENGGKHAGCSAEGECPALTAAIAKR